MQAIFKAVELSFCLSSVFYIVSLYWQHIVKPYGTAVLLTVTVCDGVQWQLVERWERVGYGQGLLCEKVIVGYQTAFWKVVV
jgi:hypothetical protein